MKYLTLLLLSVAGLPLAVAQEQADTAPTPTEWTMADCVAYAREHSTDIQRSLLQVEQSGVDVATAHAEYWPSLSFSTSYNLQNRPGVSPANSQQGQLGLNAQWTVFNGKRKKNIEQSQNSLQQSQLTAEQTENAIVESIMQMYVQVLYQQEAVAVSEATLRNSEELANVAQERVAVGAISQSDYKQVKAQVSQDRYKLVNAKAALSENVLRLKMLIDLHDQQTMTLATPTYTDADVLAPLPTVDEVLAAAIEIRPELKSSKLDVAQSELSIDLARAGYYPTVSLSAQSGTSYSPTADDAISSQLKDSWANTLGITVSIPLINGRQNKSSVQKAQINKDKALKTLHSAEDDLRQNIELMWLSASTAQESYVAAIEQIEATQESYNLMEEQFRQGLKTATDLLGEKTKLLSAVQSSVQAKYMAVYNVSLLKFYSGELKW